MTKHFYGLLLTALTAGLMPGLSCARTVVSAAAAVPEEASKYASSAAFDGERRKAIEMVKKDDPVSDAFIKRWFGALPSSAYVTPMHIIGGVSGPTEIFFAKDNHGVWRKLEEVAVPGAASGAGLRKAKAMQADPAGQKGISKASETRQ